MPKTPQTLNKPARPPWYRRRLLWISLLLLLTLWIVKESHWVNEEQKLRQQISNQLKEQFSHEHQQYQSKFGLIPQPHLPISHQRAILFVHGLDEPGGLWQDAYTHLRDEAYDLHQLRYPNDQKIHNSSALLICALLELSALNYQEITIIAHSMGGLVTRNALSHGDFQYTALRQQGEIAPIPRIFLIATPNHGSDWARLRGFLEIRDQLHQVWQGDWHWLQIFFDGNGEAKADLIPQSPFLRQLATNPLPPETEWISINALFTETEAGSPLANYLDPIGDGVVPYQSAQWSGADHQHTVIANHLSILRNHSWQKDRIPPAIPIIKKYLQDATLPNP